jgi:hypothetical protein
MGKMHEVSFEFLDDGSISLEQQSGLDDPSVIYLHPEQLKFITRRMCGMDDPSAARVEDLERKLAILAGDIDFIVKNKSVRRDIIDSGCGCEFELLSRLDALWDLAIEYDGGRLLPRERPVETQAPQKPASGDPAGNHSTTPSADPTNSAKRDSAGQLGLDV